MLSLYTISHVHLIYRKWCRVYLNGKSFCVYILTCNDLCFSAYLMVDTESQLGISASTPQMIYPVAGGSSGEGSQLELSMYNVARVVMNQVINI